MIEPKLEVPTELRDLAEKTIDQAEKAFGMFFDAANKSVTSISSPGTQISKQALSFTEQNMKAAFEHARKLVHATDLQQAMQIQSEFLKKSVHQRRRSHAADHGRRHVCRQGCDESQILKMHVRSPGAACAKSAAHKIVLRGRRVVDFNFVCRSLTGHRVLSSAVCQPFC